MNTKLERAFKMRITKIGNLQVSAEGYGCMGLSHAYGAPVEHNTAVKMIRRAFDMGCTFFDTAEGYKGTFADGSISYNEELVGEALKEHRNEVVIATKFGVTPTRDGIKTDSRPETIRKSVEGSLKKLGTDHIDLYYQHRQDANVPVEEVAGVMSKLMEEGKILHWGLSEVGEVVIRRANAVCPVTAIQNRYHMMHRDYEKLFPVLEELGIGFVAFSPLANGLLSDKYTEKSVFTDKADYRSTMPQFKAEAYEKNKALFEFLRELSAEHNCSPAQLSLAWMMNKKPYIVPIPGTKNAERLEENLKAADVILNNEEVKLIDERLDDMTMSEYFGGSPIIK